VSATGYCCKTKDALLHNHYSLIHAGLIKRAEPLTKEVGLLHVMIMQKMRRKLNLPDMPFSFEITLCFNPLANAAMVDLIKKSNLDYHGRY